MKLFKRVGILTAFLAVFVAAGCDDGSCEDAGRTFEEGSQWTCSDGCNSCACNNGETTTTAIGCEGPPGEAAGKLLCFNGDKWVKHGTTWACDDGCCECIDGDVAATPDAC